MATSTTDDRIEKAFEDVCHELQERNFVDIAQPMRDGDRTVRDFLRDAYDASIGRYLACHPSKDWWEEPEFRRFTFAHADLIVFRAWRLANPSDDEGTRMPSEAEFREAQARVFAWRKDRYCRNLTPCENEGGGEKAAFGAKAVFGGICPTG